MMVTESAESVFSAPSSDRAQVKLASAAQMGPLAPLAATSAGSSLVGASSGPLKLISMSLTPDGSHQSEPVQTFMGPWGKGYY